MKRGQRLSAAAIGCAILLLPGGAAAGAIGEGDACLTFREGRFSDFILEEDGGVLLFSSQTQPALRWREGQWEHAALGVEGTVVDAAAVSPGRWRLLSLVSAEQVALYEYADGKVQDAARLTGLFEDPGLHLSRDGATWVTSGDGCAYGLRKGETLRHEFGSPVTEESRSRLYYQPIVSAEAPDGALWFWSHTQHEDLGLPATNPAVQGFHVYQDGGWRTVSFGRKIGGVVPEKAGNAMRVACRYSNLTDVAAADGAARELALDLPPGEHCLFLHRTPAGHLLAVAARPSMHDRLAPIYGGRVGQLLAIRDRQVQVLLPGVDCARKVYDRGRPVADVPEGTFIAEALSGLLFVSADLKTVKRLDWRVGLPLSEVTRLRVCGNRLYILDSSRGFAAYDYRRLLDAGEASEARSWETVAVASAPVMSRDGSVWYVTAAQPAELRRCRGTQVTSIALEGSQFPVENLWYLTVDTQNRPWLIGNYLTHRAAFWDNGRWRTFALREEAYSTVALEEVGRADFQIGTPADFCFPALPGDGRVAYQNEWMRICWFDGKRWDYSYTSVGDINGESPQGPPFYLGGALCVRAGQSFYAMVEGEWQPLGGAAVSPYGENPRQVRHYEPLPEGFPGRDRWASISVRDSTGVLWAGSTAQLYRGLNDTWIPVPARGSPLFASEDVIRCLPDRDGNVWISLFWGDYPCLARYRPAVPEGAPPQLAWAELPPARTETGDIAFRVRATGGSGRLFLSFQCDDGQWTQQPVSGPTNEIAVASLSNGAHRCRFQLHDGDLRGSAALEHAFTAKRDYEGEVKALAAGLGSDSFAGREAAEKRLIEMGPVAAPLLKPYRDSEDPEIAFRAGRVLKALSPRPEPRPQAQEMQQMAPSSRRVWIR